MGIKRSLDEKNQRYPKKSISMRYFLPLVLTIFTFTSQAREIADAWLGTWISEEFAEAPAVDSIIIGKDYFIFRNKHCDWSKNRPSKARSCSAYYSEGINKSDLMKTLSFSKKAVSQRVDAGIIDPWMIDPADLVKKYNKNKKFIEKLPTKNFPTIDIREHDLSGGGADCGSFFFRHKNEIYYFYFCDPAPEALEIIKYKKYTPY